MRAKILVAGFLLPFLSLFGVVSSHAEVTGTWFATLPAGGASRALILQLHQRSDGRVLGYIPGGTAHSVVTGGSVSGPGIRLEMETKDPQVTRVFTLDGSVRRNIIDGTVDDGSGPRPIRLHRTARVFHEHRFLFAKPPVGSGEPTGIVDLSVVLDPRDRFVNGGFISQTDCSLFACGGVATSFSEAGGTVTVGLETGGACSGSGSFTATFDSATKLYSGTYTFTNCTSTDSGALVGVKTAQTQTDHVAGVLATLGRIADDLQARITFTAPYAPVSPHYFHSSKTEADLLAEFNAEVATYDSIDVMLNRFRNIKTVNDPDTNPAFDTPIGVDFHDRRTGVPLGGGSAVTIRDADTGTGVPSDTELKFFAEEADAWVVIGNGEIALPSLLHFQTNRSDRFPIDIPFIDAGHPFKGRRALSPHQGAHVHWDNSTNTWPRGGTAVSNYPAIYAVADGVVDRVDYTFRVGANDRYGVDIAFAQDGSQVYVFAYSIEPMIPEPAPDFYRPFILVSRGQRVSKGDIIAYMYLPPGAGIGSHVHFHIKPKNTSLFQAPAIFSEALVDSFFARWNTFANDTDGTTSVPMPSCMGYMLDDNMLDVHENPYGNFPVDVLK